MTFVGCRFAAVAMVVVGCATSDDVAVNVPSMETSSEMSSTSTTSVVSEPASARIEVRTIGQSIQGRPIDVWHRVDLPAADVASDVSRVVVLVIGSIHGNEPAGLDVVDVLANLPAGEIEKFGPIDLWLLPTGNPDGIAEGTRHNARQVDLNRNFPLDWNELQRPGDYEYAGSEPASEPETRAMMTFIEELRPDLTVWFHQDAFRVAPSWRKDREVRELYAYLTGLPLLAVEGGTYTGVAATWHRRTFDAVSFIVELGKTLSPREALVHAQAVLSVTSVLPD